MSPCPTIEGYDVVRKLGGGNMGTVYLAFREEDGRQVAIKVVSGGRSQEDEEKIAIEKNGAELQQRIRHAAPLHIVGVNRILFRNGDLILEMEYVSGDNLGELLRVRKSLTPKRAAMIALELARMLDNLDSIDPPVVHGDLKPSNVLVKGEAEVKVVDFGIAKQLSNGLGTFNQYQSIPYSSPERLRTGDVDLQSDLWAVAVMLYEMTAGCHPFNAPLNMIRMRTLDGRGPDPLPADCPEALSKIIYKALAANQSDRYPTAKELSQDLERYLNGQPVTASMPDPDATVRTPRPAPIPPPLPSQAPVMSHHIGDVLRQLNRHRSDVRLIAAGVVFFLMLYLGHQQYEVGRSAGETRRALLSGQLGILQGWDRFSDLRKSAWVPFLLWGLQDTLKSKLLEEGSEPIIDYRQDLPTATLADWQRGADDLRRILEIDPHNKLAKGREEICEGNIARIRARSTSHGKWVTNPKLLSQAIGHFQQAAELMPDSPDPYLAMAPVYLYYQQDYERGMAMQQAAVKRGHTAGKRETAQMADTLKANARNDLAMAQQLNDDPARRKEHLQNAISAFESSIEYYGQIAGFAGATQGMKEAIQGKQQAQKLLDQLEEK
jgi:serine/threonine protein kinase